jgi:hypothetical protein
MITVLVHSCTNCSTAQRASVRRDHMHTAAIGCQSHRERCVGERVREIRQRPAGNGGPVLNGIAYQQRAITGHVFAHEAHRTEWLLDLPHLIAQVHVARHLRQLSVRLMSSIGHCNQRQAQTTMKTLGNLSHHHSFSRSLSLVDCFTHSLTRCTQCNDG